MQKCDNGEFVPVEFMSKVWDDNEINWPITIKELAAMLEAIRKWEKCLNYNTY